MSEISIDWVKLSDLNIEPTNPKEHDVEKIMLSIERFGFINPFIKNMETGKLLAGHGRKKALELMRRKELTIPDRLKEEDGDWLVPVVSGVQFDTEEEAMAYIIADNRLVELGGWNTPELLEAIAEIQESSPDLDDIGFNERELDLLYEETEGPIDFDTGEPEPTVEFEENKYFDIMFEEEYQQQVFYQFLDFVKRKYPGETIAAKLNNHILDLLSDG